MERKLEDMERQLEKARKDNDDLKSSHASSYGKLAQALVELDLIKGLLSLLKQVVTQQDGWTNILQLVSLRFLFLHMWILFGQ
ncbi:hypothetical protein OIU84_015829 [Salix udensis]|uniref:Uncharacterized protein n=1 Tax=Salix udensis TaxID=889485 RepID=A0AAD6J7S7_9ROSI|nr:hypothetical protein OIU84_015829 [Salix udensis]